MLYAGHTEKEGIPFEKENLVIGKEIANAKLSNLKLVFLNSCHSAYESRHTGGLAASFLKAGAGYVIGFLSPVEPKIAEAAGERFWKEYLKQKDIYKSYQKTKQYLLDSDTKSLLGALSFVCFAPEKPKKNYTWLTTSFFVILIGGFLYSFSFFRQDDPSPTTAIPEIGQKKISRETKREEKPVAKPKLSETEILISKIQDVQFKKEASSFLKKDHPLLDKEAKETILNGILREDKTESLKYYEFKSKIGHSP